MAAATVQWELGIRSEFQVMVCRRDLDEAGSVLRAIKADSVGTSLGRSRRLCGHETPETPPLEHGLKQPGSPWSSPVWVGSLYWGDAAGVLGTRDRRVRCCAALGVLGLAPATRADVPPAA